MPSSRSSTLSSRQRADSAVPLVYKEISSIKCVTCTPTAAAAMRCLYCRVCSADAVCCVSSNAHMLSHDSGPLVQTVIDLPTNLPILFLVLDSKTCWQLLQIRFVRPDSNMRLMSANRAAVTHVVILAPLLLMTRI